MRSRSPGACGAITLAKPKSHRFSIRAATSDVLLIVRVAHAAIDEPRQARAA
jgi:hypothetical protein